MWDTVQIALGRKASWTRKYRNSALVLLCGKPGENDQEMDAEAFGMREGHI